MRWILVAALFCSGLYAHYHFSAQPLVIKLVGWMVLVSVGLWVASTTESGKRALQFFNDARLELKKVVWPTKQETGQVTLLVLVMVTIASLFFWAIDSILLRLVAWLTGFSA